MTQPESPIQHRQEAAAPGPSQAGLEEPIQPIAEYSHATLSSLWLDTTVEKPVQPIADYSVVALVLGLLGLVPISGFIPGIIAIVLGCKTRQEFDAAWAAGNFPVNRKTGILANRRFATAGLVLGIISIPLSIITWIVWG